MKLAKRPNPQCARRRWMAAVLAVLLLCASLWLYGPRLWPGPGQVGGFEPPAGDQTTSVELPLALVADYYEHMKEHAPPYQADGEMQRREWEYQAPEDPFKLLQSHLGSDASGNARLSQLLRSMEERWNRGGVLGSNDGKALEDLAAASSLDAQSLLEAGRGLQFLTGDDLAAALYRAGIAKAGKQFRQVRPGDPSALPLLHVLDQTSVLYRLHDYASLARRFTLAMQLYPPLSVESRRAGCLCADALSAGAQAQPAADMILQVVRQNEQAGDLSDRVDLPELDWRAGRYLAAARRYDNAIAFYSQYARVGDDPVRKRQAQILWAICLDNIGQHDKAAVLRKEFQIPPLMPQSRPASRSANGN